MWLARKIFMENLRKRGLKSLQRKVKGEEKREDMLVAKKGNKKTVGRKGCKSSLRRLKVILKELKTKVAEKQAEKNCDIELQRKWDAKLEQLRSQCTQIRRQNRVVFGDNECNQLCIDLMLALLQALDEGDSANFDLVNQSLGLVSPNFFGFPTYD